MYSFTNARLMCGRFYTSFTKLRENPEKCFKYFQMNVRSFEELIIKLQLRYSHKIHGCDVVYFH